MTDTPDPLYVAVTTFGCQVDGEEFLVRAGTRWKGEVVRLHPKWFVPVAESDEPTIAKGRARTCRRWPNLEDVRVATSRNDGPCRSGVDVVHPVTSDHGPGAGGCRRSDRLATSTPPVTGYPPDRDSLK